MHPVRCRWERSRSCYAVPAEFARPGSPAKGKGHAISPTAAELGGDQFAVEPGLASGFGQELLEAVAILGKNAKRRKAAVSTERRRDGHRIGEVCVLAGIAEQEFSSWRFGQYIRHRWREAALDGGLREAITITEVRLAFRQAARFVHG